jgi:hypothetical protein
MSQEPQTIVKRISSAENLRPSTPFPETNDNESTSSNSDADREQLGKELRKISISPPTPRHKRVLVMPRACINCNGTGSVEIQLHTRMGFQHANSGCAPCPDCFRRPTTPCLQRQPIGLHEQISGALKLQCCCGRMFGSHCVPFATIVGVKGERLAMCIECNGVLVETSAEKS